MFAFWLAGEGVDSWQALKSTWPCEEGFLKKTMFEASFAALWGIRGSKVDKYQFSFQWKKTIFPVRKRGNVGQRGHFVRATKEIVLVGKIKGWAFWVWKGIFLTVSLASNHRSLFALESDFARFLESSASVNKTLVFFIELLMWNVLYNLFAFSRGLWVYLL